MGGSGITVAETTNYRWTLWENWSMDKSRYWLELTRKPDGERMEIRSNPYKYEEGYTENDEVDKAYKEFEVEFKQKSNYSEMTKEQITLAEMYARMRDAERLRDTYYERMKQAEKLFSDFQNYIDGLERRELEKQKLGGEG